MPRRAWVAVIAIAVLAGCSDSDASSAPATSAASTTAAPTTASSPTTAPSTTAPSTSTAPATTAAPTAAPGTSAPGTSAAPTTTVPPVAASAGCGASTVAPGEATLDLTAAGLAGTYIRHVPPAHDGTTPVPVVLGLHGWSEPAVVLGIQSDLPARSDADGFVAVLPNITRPTPLWDTALDGADVQWIAALLDTLEQDLCVDTNRVFVTGMSNGAMMTSTLACVMADRIAAVAPVAGVRLPDGCSPARPVPMIAFHGTDDQYLAFEGGFGTKVSGLASPDGSGTLGDVLATGPDAVAVPDRVQAWSALDGCDGDLVTEPVADDVTLLRTESCAVPVELYVVDGGGHTWPGSDFDATIADLVGPVTESIDATTLLLAFFQSHPLPA